MDITKEPNLEELKKAWEALSHLIKFAHSLGEPLAVVEEKPIDIPTTPVVDPVPKPIPEPEVIITTPPPLPPPLPEVKPVIVVTSDFGYCNLESPITGGRGGDKITVKTHADFLAATQVSDNKIILLGVNITAPTGKTGFTGRDISNKTIIGLPGVALLGMGTWFLNAKNIIIRNILYDDIPLNSDLDYLAFRNTMQVWVDHCEFRAKTGMDGCVDITQGSDLFTVTHCRIKGATKAMLIGSGDTNIADKTKLRTTIAFNHFLDNFERQPSYRFGIGCHTMNNLYEHSDEFKTPLTYQPYCQGSRVGGIIRNDGNVFLNIKGNTHQSMDSEGEPHQPHGMFSGLDTNHYIGCNINMAKIKGTQSNWTPPYEYVSRLLTKERVLELGTKAGPTLTLAEINSFIK